MFCYILPKRNIFPLIARPLFSLSPLRLLLKPPCRRNQSKKLFSSSIGGANDIRGCQYDYQNSDTIWNQQYEALLEWSEQHKGDCNAPANERVILEDGTEQNLGQWLRRQRTLYNRGKLRTDRQNRLQILVDAGKLSWDIIHVDAWEQQYEALLAWSEKHDGDCNIPRDDVTLEDGREMILGAWLCRQRVLYKQGELSPEREYRLQSLVNAGKLSWEVDYDNIWERQYRALSLWSERHEGDCNVPYIETVPLKDGTLLDLGKWLDNQRTQYSKGKLRPDRQKRLQSLVDQQRLRWTREISSEK